MAGSGGGENIFYGRGSLRLSKVIEVERVRVYLGNREEFNWSISFVEKEGGKSLVFLGEDCERIGC